MMNYKAIIPCAGFGTRMNMTSNQSKEMIIDPKTQSPLIDYTLGLCAVYRLNPLIITRSEKKDLIEYLKLKNIHFIINDDPGEWMDSVLSSQHHWLDNNILLLPDTRFQPISVVGAIKEKLNNNDLAFATHKVDDVRAWGSIKDGQLTEKSSVFEPGNAWGIIGFKKEVGLDLFFSMKERDKPIKLKNYECVELKSFIDLTRTGKIEKYE